MLDIPKPTQNSYRNPSLMLELYPSLMLQNPYQNISDYVKVGQGRLRLGTGLGCLVKVDLSLIRSVEVGRRLLRHCKYPCLKSKSVLKSDA